MATLQQGRVKSVLSGDTLVLQSKSRQERTLSLAFVSAPRLAANEPGAFESRDILRKLCVGKHVHFHVVYGVPQKVGGVNRDYGVVTLPGGQQLPAVIVQEGWVRLRDDAERKAADNPATGPLLSQLQSLENYAKSAGVGVWANHVPAIGTLMDTPDVKTFAEQHKGQLLDSIVERVVSGDRLVCRLMLSPEHHLQVPVLVAGVKAPATARTNPADGSTQPAEPLGNEAQIFVEDRVLQRGVKTKILGVSPNGVLVGEVRHALGSIAEFLLSEGLARCVDHHSTMLGSEMAKLRQAERRARERNLGVFKGNSTYKAGSAEIEAVVSRVLSADQIFVRTKSSQEKRVSLSSVRQPKPTDPKQAQFGADAKEFLRKRVIGKHVRISTDGKRPASEGYDEREMCTVMLNDTNVALLLVENGYASVIRHRMDDQDRSPIYDSLLAAEEAAQSGQKGMWSPKPPKTPHYVDYSESLEKAKRQMTTFSRQKKIPAVVDFVKSGSRFTILVPRENAKITLVLGGICAPRSARGPNEKGVPYGQEAHDFAVKRCMQRDAEVDVEGLDKIGGFIGQLYINRENFAKALVEEGLASVHAYSAEKSGNAAELYAAESRAKEARKGMWHNWDPSQDKQEEATDAESIVVNGTNGEMSTKKDYRDVVVTYVDPTTCHLKLQMLTNKVALQTLMKEFSSFHKSNTSSTSLPSDPKVGDLVSARFSSDGEWYRARIRRNDHSAKTCEVLYIDYGNSETQPWNALRPLDESRFGAAKLRPQAVDATLSFIQFPTNAEYASDAAHFIEEVVWNKELVASVDATEGNTLIVTLMDPNGNPSGVRDSVNAEVVENGYAMVAKRLRPWERANAEATKDLKQKQTQAEEERRGMWEYGDITED
ncbi:putative transcription factor [Piedraia hortae CBS 480.64]|uniref:Probable endonuclease LCL3 n=1 Tax=Piedraia hortae CBS 480.64 TaxID=1314780 RepID=A0A6A7BRB5_9PEZI|nr:putative transcription factor [Piedraia hortae CBS 480.64]